MQIKPLLLLLLPPLLLLLLLLKRKPHCISTVCSTGFGG